MDDATLTIGEIAGRAGVNTSAIRFYEREGLLPDPERVGGQRRYTTEVVRRLGVIDVAKRAGFSLDEIRVLLGAADTGEPAHTELRALALRKRDELDALIKRAEAMRRWLAAAEDCECVAFDVCALFEQDIAALPPREHHPGLTALG